MAPAAGTRPRRSPVMKVGRDPGEDRLEGEQERGVRGGQDRLGPALDGECGGGGECCGDHEGGDEASGEVDVGVLNERKADRHEECAEADLKNGERLEGNARRDMAEGDAVKRESDGAAEGEDVAEVNGGEIRKQGREDCEDAARTGRRCSEKQDADEGESGAEKGVPAGCACTGRPKRWCDGEERNEDDDESGDEGGFGGRGAHEADGLELVAGGETEADDGSREDVGAAESVPVAVVGDGKEREGQRHADEVEGRRRGSRRARL